MHSPDIESACEKVQTGLSQRLTRTERVVLAPFAVPALQITERGSRRAGALRGAGAGGGASAVAPAGNTGEEHLSFVARLELQRRSEEQGFGESGVKDSGVLRSHRDRYLLKVIYLYRHFFCDVRHCNIV